MSGEPAASDRAAARREAANVLRVISATAGYGARQLADGLSPQQAQAAAIEAACELERAASALRRLAVPPLSPAARRHRALALIESGATQREAAAAVGVSPRRVWDYLHGRSLTTGRSAGPPPGHWPIE